MKFYILILSIFLLSSCSLKQDEIEVNLKTQTLMYAQKVNLSHEDLNAVATFSYLNPVLDQKANENIFVFSVTPSDFYVEGFEIWINDKKAKIEKIYEGDELLKYLISNDYTTYYKISTPINEDEKFFVLKACLPFQPCFELNFQKYSKSLYYRSEDVDTQYN